MNTNSDLQKRKVAVVGRYFEALATGNFGILDEILAQDLVWHQPGQGELSGVHRGKAKVFELFGEFMKRSAGSFRIESVGDVMTNGDLVTATLRFSAKRGDGRSIAMSGVDLMRIEDGRIREVHLFSQDQDAEDRFWG